MQGIARIYEHLTPTMEQQTTNALEHRWNQSLQTLTTAEQDELSGWYPHVKQNIHDLQQAQVQAS